MILPQEKEYIIAVLGLHYSPKILKHFEEKEIRNSKNEPFSNNSIRQIVNGEQQNLEVEYDIMCFVEAEQKRIKKMLSKRSKTLKK